MTHVFFIADRRTFFRPLNGKRRELVGDCIRTLYERLHGPGADYSRSLTRDGLKELLLPVIQLATPENDEGFAGSKDELASIDVHDDQQVAAAVIRSLVEDGWLESYSDRAGLTAALRFTRAGKLFAEALWSLDRVRARSRQRNVRSCRNALDATLRTADAYDLVDAYDYAEKIVSDLSEGVDYFQELVRRLMSEASQTPWSEFIEFLNKFEKEFKKQLTADNVERHRQAIRDLLLRLRSLPNEKYVAIETQLRDVAPWATEQRTGDSNFDWILTRIEDLVEAACQTKHPEMLRAMNLYMRQAASIVQQAISIRGGQSRHAFSRAIARLADLSGEQQDRLLAKLGEKIATAEVRLLDPATFRFRSATQRRKTLTVVIQPRVTREARLTAAIQRAEAGAFAVSNDELLTHLRGQLRLRGGRLLLSTLPIVSAIDVLHIMQAVEAVRGSRDTTLKATQLQSRFNNGYFDASDYEIEMSNETHNGRT